MHSQERKGNYVFKKVKANKRVSIQNMQKI